MIYIYISKIQFLRGKIQVLLVFLVKIWILAGNPFSHMVLVCNVKKLPHLPHYHYQPVCQPYQSCCSWCLCREVGLRFRLNELEGVEFVKTGMEVGREDRRVGERRAVDGRDLLQNAEVLCLGD